MLDEISLVICATNITTIIWPHIVHKIAMDRPSMVLGVLSPYLVSEKTMISVYEFCLTP